MRIKLNLNEAVAAVKGPEHYQWFTYNHKAPFPMLLRNNVVTLALGDQFGLRSGTGGTMRLVLGQDVSKVLTITVAEQVLLTERSTASKGKGVKPKTRAANKAVEGSGAPEGVDAVTVWNTSIAPLLKELRLKIAACEVPETSVDTIQIDLDSAIKPLYSAKSITPTMVQAFSANIQRILKLKISKQRLPAKPSQMQTAGIQTLTAAKKNRNFLPTSFKASSVDDIHYIVGSLRDLASHIKLAHWLFVENKAQAKKASFMDTVSRDELPNKVWDFVQENLR